MLFSSVESVGIGGKGNARDTESASLKDCARSTGIYDILTEIKASVNAGEDKIVVLFKTENCKSDTVSRR